MGVPPDARLNKEGGFGLRFAHRVARRGSRAAGVPSSLREDRFGASPLAPLRPLTRNAGSPLGRASASDSLCR